MRKWLDKISKINYDKYQENLLLYIIDNLLFWDIQHRDWLMEVTRVTQELAQKNTQSSEFQLRGNILYKNILEVNFQLLVFYNNFIIEISKIIKDDTLFKEHLDKNIAINPYTRIRNWKIESVKKISKMITHFRDWICHEKTAEIHRNPIFMKYGIDWWYSYLEKCVDAQYRWTFTMGAWYMSFDTIVQIITQYIEYYKLAD